MAPSARCSASPRPSAQRYPPNRTDVSSLRLKSSKVCACCRASSEGRVRPEFRVATENWSTPYGPSIGRWRRIGLIPRIWSAGSRITRERRQRGPATAGSISALTRAAVVSAPMIDHHCRARPDTSCKREHATTMRITLLRTRMNCLSTPCLPLGGACGLLARHPLR
jgi:hypothetical protein